MSVILKKLIIEDIVIQYRLEYKRVKNINLRIKQDGTICVSVNRFVPQKAVDEFIISKSDFIKKALENCKSKSETSKKQYFSEGEIKDIVNDLCIKFYPYFERRGVEYPQIKFRKMVSRWGSCHFQKGILTFNTNLMYAPKECVEYVVLHEFTHFLQPNHSKAFYEELSVICPQWKIYKNKLKEIFL